MGGVAFYICFILGFYIIRGFDNGDLMVTIIAGMTILFITGLKDDLTILAPGSKLLAQTMASSLILFNTSFQIRTFHNFLGITDIHPIVGAVLGLFFMLYIINAFNLIDGIDGLAGSIGLLSFTAFGIIFALLGNKFYLGVCLIGMGTLLGFLKYNLSQRRKIFMGDTGSMLLGFVIGLLFLKILTSKVNVLEAKLPIDEINLPVFLVAVVFVPLFDMGRVFLIRLLKGGSPFKADRNHIHHILIDNFGISHKNTSLIIFSGNVFLIILFFILGTFTNYWIMLGSMIAVILGLLLIFSPYILGQKKQYGTAGKITEVENIK